MESTRFSDMAEGFIAGTRLRAMLINSLVDACGELDIDIEALSDKCFFLSGAGESLDAPGDNPDDFIRFMTKKNINFEVFQKEVVKLDPVHSVARFHSCPLYTAWKNAGLPAERIAYLCDLACKADQGRASNFKNVELTFPKRLAQGDPYCELDAKQRTSER